MTISDITLPGVNTYVFASLAQVEIANISFGQVVLTFTNGAKLAILGAANDSFVIGGEAAIDYVAFTAMLPVANTAPRARPPAPVSVGEDGELPIKATMLGYFDAEGNALARITITVLPVSGELLLDGVAVTVGEDVTAQQIADGDLVYRPAAGLKANVDGSFSFTVNDGTTDSTEATLTITVTADDDAPTATPQTDVSVAKTERFPSRRRCSVMLMKIRWPGSPSPCCR